VDSLNSALETASNTALWHEIENIFVVGGSEIYKLALESNMCRNIYYTAIFDEGKTQNLSFIWN